MQLLFLNLASRFFLPLKLLSISEASPFLFYPPFPRFFSSSDVFRCLDFSFSDFEKKKICPYAFEIAIGLQVCPEISKNSSRNYSYSDDEGFIQQIH